MRWIFLWILVGACRDGSAPPPAPAPDHRAPVHAGSATSVGTGAGTETPRPILAAEPREAEPIPEITTEKTFEVEAVDRAWKATTEAEVRRRVPSVTELECHSTICKLTLTGSPRELTKVLDEIETERSLHGIADSILLGAPETHTDGTMAVHAFARFARQQP